MKNLKLTSLSIFGMTPVDCLRSCTPKFTYCRLKASGSRDRIQSKGCSVPDQIGARINLMPLLDTARILG